MDLNNFFSIFNNQGNNGIIFKIAMVILAGFYFLYALVISKQVKVMDQTLQDKYNWLIYIITSVQIAVSLILLILVIFLL